MKSEIRPAIVAFATDPCHPGLSLFRQSLDRFGWTDRHLIVDRWGGWGYRLKKVLEYALRLRGTGISHVISLDAYDTMALAKPNRFAEEMEALGCPRLLYAAEKACWPNLQYSSHPRYRDASHGSPWRYAHSPFVLDLSRPIPDGFGEIDDTYDDQLHAHDLYLNSIEGVQIDHECRIVQSIAFCNHWQDDFALDEDARGILLNLKTGSRPLFAHGNGGTDMEWLGGLKK